MMRSGTSSAITGKALLVDRTCPVCGSARFEGYAQKGELKLVRCVECTMIYLNPVPAEYTSGTYYDGAGAGYYLSPAKLESDYAPVRFERELKLFRRFVPTGAVLDVGCSSGAFLYQLTHQSPGAYKAVGADASGPALDYAQSRGLTVVRGNYLDHTFDGQQFDAVTIWAVLEHLAEPKAFLEHAWELLKPGGLCFVLVPNSRSLAFRILGVRYRYVYPQHLNYFTAATLSRLAGARFEILARRFTHFNPIIIWQDWRSRGRDIPNAERGALLQRTTAYKQNPLLRPVLAFYRISEAVLGALSLADNLVLVLRKR